MQVVALLEITRAVRSLISENGIDMADSHRPPSVRLCSVADMVARVATEPVGAHGSSPPLVSLASHVECRRVNSAKHKTHGDKAECT